MAVSQEPLSVRNNNPGNLRYVGQEGASPGEGGFAKFETPQAGVDAMRRQIELDTQTRGMNLTQFINKYAPPSENKTQKYIEFVVQKVGLDPSQPVPREKIPALQAAMVEMEGGSRAVAAFNLASAPQATPARPTTQATRTTKPVQVAAAAAPAAKLTLTDLPPGYRAALAANYIADTEDPSQSIAEKAMAMMEELQGGGGGPKGVATFNKAMGSEAGVDPFVLMAKAQEGQEQAPKMRRRPVPRMPVRFAEGGEANANDIDTQLQELYRQSLGREADTGGFEYWKKEFGPEIDTAERLRFIEGAAPEVQQRLAAGDKNLPAYMQVNPEVRRALASQDLTTEQYRTLANYFGNQWIGGEAEDPASLTRRDYIERPRSGYDFATFLATRSQQHGAQADTQNRMANLLAPYLGNVGQATGVGGESFDQYIVNPMTGQTEIAKPLGVDNMYRIYRGPHQGTIGDPEKGSRYAVGMDYKVDPVTGQATFVGPYTEYYKDLGHNDWQGPLGILGTAAGLYFFPGMDLGSMLTRGAITLGTEGAKRMFKEGGEVDKEDTELSNEERREQIDRQMRIAEQGMSYSAGPLGIRAIKKPGGYEARVSSQIDRLTPYLDFDPLTGTFRPTEVGASYGNMRPEGGYEIRYSHPLTAQGVPQLSGQYRQQLGRNAELQASGYYSPIPNARDAYGANVRYIQRFEKGGDVSNPADIAEQMTVGTVPEGKPGAAAQVAKDVVRGAQYLPYDLLGAPVDIATMAMRPFGYNVEKPFLGSEYLIDKAVQAGIADRPTGSLAETTSRIGMGFVNPAAVARQIPKGIASLEKGVEQLTLPAFRKLTGNPDATKEQMMDFVLNQKSIMQAGAPAAARPLGSAINTQPEVMKLRQAVREELDIVPLPKTFTSEEGRAFQESYYAAKEKYGPQMEAIEKTLVPKLENYFTRQYGTVNDPLYQATLEGKYMPRAFYSPNATFRWDKKTVVETTGLSLAKDDKLTMEHVNKLKELSSQGNKKAQLILAKAYDLADRPEAFQTPISIAESLKNPQNFSYMVERLKAYDVKNPEEVIKTYVANAPKLKSPQMDDNFNKLEAIAVTKYDADAKKLLEEQAKNLTIPTLSPHSRMVSSVYPFKDLTEKTRQEIIRGKPMYQTNNMFGQNIDYRDIVDYVLKAPLDKWQKMSVPELIIASHVNPANVTKPSKVARMADDGVELLPFQKIMGTTEYLPVKSKMLGDGAQWREITTKEGMRIEGGLMDHCLKKDSLGYCNRLLNKESKYFTLRDADGHPYVSIEMTKPMGQEKQDVPFNVIRQVKGYMNSKAVPAYGEEISDFLTAWENQIGVKLRPAENPDYLPEKFKPQQFGIQSPPENMAKGGMVDKPLYDRAA